MMRPDRESMSKDDNSAERSQSVVEEAVRQVMGTMHNIKPSRASQDAALGPTPMSQITLDSVLVEALLDTGSPISIVSLEFYLKVAAQNRKPDQSPAEWGKEVCENLKPTTVSLRSYGGDELEIVSQVTCHLGRDGYQVKTVLQVQRGAPVDLLLGTDVLSQLGFSLMQTSKQGPATDLLNPNSKITVLGSVQPTQQDGSGVVASQQEPKTRVTNGSARVKLIQAARVPAQHSKLIRVDVVDPDFESETCLFEPEHHVLEQRGLAMADAVVEIADSKGMTLLITNHGTEPVTLECGEVLGNLQPATLVEDGDQIDGTMEVEPHSTPCVAALQGETDNEGRTSTLLGALGLDQMELPQKELDELQGLVVEFASLFALDATELGRTSIVTHTINTGDCPPVRQPPRRVPFSLRGKVCQLIDNMLKQGVIVPSSSPWASPIVLVAKQDGSTRFCVDYRKLNAVTKLDVFPLPRIDDSLDLLAGTQYFTSLDLASGYWQVGMHEDSQEKTAFTTHAGLYEFTVMPFGLCNAPATFQRLMESVLSGLARKKCLVYLDDILVIGRTFEEHLSNLREVFTRLTRAGLKLKPSKCKLARGEVDFLGYVVSRNGISADPKKVSAVIEYPTPVDLKSLRAFLGLTSYYRRFVPSFSSVAQPLYALTRKEVPFVWSQECDVAFTQLKRALAESPVLAYPNFGRDFLLETDASGMGLGAILSQKQDDGTIRPIAFASRTLQNHEKNYGISELEALAVVWAVKHFRHYIYGHHCTVFTDHEALKSLLNTPHPSGKLARWGMALQELDLKIEYQPGRVNGRADALSRYPVPLQKSDCVQTQAHSVVAAVQIPNTQAGGGEECESDSLSKRQREDPYLKEIITYLETGDLPTEEKRARELVLGSSQFTLNDRILYRVEADKSLRIIPPATDRQKLFKEAHQGPFSGHLREAKIHSELSRHYWWPGMRRDIAQMCRSCLTCATRGVGKPVKPPLTPIPVNGPFDRVGVDVLQLPKTRQGNRYAVVFMDYLTKWPEVYATPDQTAPTIAKLLVEKVISRHGVPHQLLSDRGPSFLSKLILEICSVMGVKKINTSAYHPQTDGLIERFNRTLTDMLAKTVKTEVEWDERLPYVLFAYRATVQASTGESPFFLLYGRDPQLPTELALAPTVARDEVQLDDYKSRMVQLMSEAWNLAQKTLKKSQQRQKKQHDKHARNADFKPGDRVYVFMPALKRGPAHKLALPYKGPYRVLQLFENGAELQLIDHPRAQTIRVALNRLRRSLEPSQKTSTGTQHTTPEASSSASLSDVVDQVAEEDVRAQELEVSSEDQEEIDTQNEATVPWKNRLRPRRTAARGRAG